MNPSSEEVLLASAQEKSSATDVAKKGNRSGTFLMDRGGVFTKSPAF
jgi:hypothetical protein